jgi:hypothetical protein
MVKDHFPLSPTDLLTFITLLEDQERLNREGPFDAPLDGSAKDRVGAALLNHVAKHGVTDEADRLTRGPSNAEFLALLEGKEHRLDQIKRRLTIATDAANEPLEEDGHIVDEVRAAADPKPAQALLKCGPGEEYFFWWGGKRYELEMEPKAWKLLVFLWGKPSVEVADVAKAVWKNKRTGYETMKPTVTRLNNAIRGNGLPSIFWAKKRGENRITYKGPPLDTSVTA